MSIPASIEFLQDYLLLQTDALGFDPSQFLADLGLGLDFTVQIGLESQQLHLIQSLRSPVPPPLSALGQTKTHTIRFKAFTETQCSNTILGFYTDTIKTHSV